MSIKGTQISLKLDTVVIAEVLKVKRPERTRAMEEITALGDAEPRFASSIPANGPLNFTVNFSDTAHAAILAADDGEEHDWELVYALDTPKSLQCSGFLASLSEGEIDDKTTHIPLEVSVQPSGPVVWDTPIAEEEEEEEE
jgi:hypothetical protein